MDTPAGLSSLWTSTAPGPAGRRNGCFPPLLAEESHEPERFRKNQEQFTHPTVLTVRQPLQTVDHPGLDRLEYTALQYDDAPPTISTWAAGAVRSFACSAGASQTRRNVWRCSWPSWTPKCSKGGLFP